MSSELIHMKKKGSYNSCEALGPPCGNPERDNVADAKELLNLDPFTGTTKRVLQRYNGGHHSVEIDESGSLCQSTTNSASNIDSIIVSTYMKNSTPACTIVSSYKLEGASSDLDGSDDSDGYLLTLRTSLSNVIFEPDEKATCFGAGINIDSDIGTLPLQIGDAAIRNSSTLMHSLRLFRYHCNTEPTSINSIYVGVRSPGVIYRWKPGSTITFNVNYDSFLNTAYAEHAKYAATSLEKASRKWNKGEFGIRFERVADGEPAVFQLTYSDCYRLNPECLAESFFPGDPPHKQQLYVYSPSFKEKNHKYMANIFCHELGHILGLRHEFAQTRSEEMRHLSVLLGERNASSVMNYFDHPGQFRIQETDYNSVRRLYEPCNDEIDGFKVVDEPLRPFVPLQRL